MVGKEAKRPIANAKKVGGIRRKDASNERKEKATNVGRIPKTGTLPVINVSKNSRLSALIPPSGKIANAKIKGLVIKKVDGGAPLGGSRKLTKKHVAGGPLNTG